MAPSTTITASSQDQLFQSLLPRSITTGKSRKYKDAFNRRLKHHNYGRTNQFEVIERLDGLEEKFQILNRDDLSDALRLRRVELRQQENEHRFLPDVLDLLLRLSVDPANIQSSDRVVVVKEEPDELPPLRWKDVEEDDPINHQDPIWQNTEYSELSSEEDEFEISSTATSPQSNRKQELLKDDHQLGDSSIFFTVNESLLKLYPKQFGEEIEGGNVLLMELQATRECLFMLQGLPTNLFSGSQLQYDINARYYLRHVHQEVFWETLRSFAGIGRQVEFVRAWLKMSQPTQYSRALRQSIADVVLKFDTEISTVQAQLLQTKVPRHAGLIPCLEAAMQLSQSVQVIEVYLHVCESKKADAIGQLEILFDLICSTQSSGNMLESTVLLQLFLPTFKIYLKPIEYWIDQGELHEKLERFFIISSGPQTNLANLWEGWFVLDTGSGSHRAPSFLQEFSNAILALGKTKLFLRRLNHTKHPIALEEPLSLSFENLRDALESSYVSFAEVFAELFNVAITPSLTKTSAILYKQLDQSCGLWTALNVFSTIYFGIQGPITDNIEMVIFRRLDKCNTAWSDRFLLIELYSSAFASIAGIDPDRLIIHSSHISSRSLTTRRKSVKVLGDLSVDYSLPWPLANVLLQPTFASYRRVALFLMQLRRSRHALLCRAHFPVMNPSLGSSKDEQSAMQALHQKLLLFTHVLYNHLTTLVIETSTSTMKHHLRNATSVDAMTQVHTKYTLELEKACLTAKKLTPIRDAVIAILDLSIRFADIVATPTNLLDGGGNNNEDDDEARSYHSAASRRRRRRRGKGEETEREEEDDEDDDNDDDEISSGDEGYSTFVILDEPSPTEEFRRMDREFERHVAFIVAGLKSVGRVVSGGGGSGGNGVELNSWDVLAARLDWKMKKDFGELTP